MPTRRHAETDSPSNPAPTAPRASRLASKTVQPARVYVDHTLDSRRWERVPLRKGDIIICTSNKTGTTWVQRVISVLLLGKKLPHTLMNISPWVDARFVPAPPEKLVADAEKFTPRRFMKSHVPFDALPYNPAVKYISIGRDGRDVALSMYNHYSGYTDKVFELLNAPEGTFDTPFPRPPSDVHVFIRNWFTKGNPAFPWESDGYPFSSHFRHVRSFWDKRHLPNVLLTHYHDLKRNFAAEIQRLALFLDIEPTEKLIRDVMSSCSFEAMKEEGKEVTPEFDGGFQGGVNRFFHSARLGRWRDVFTPGELALYQAAVARNLAPDCANWLEHGRLASGIDPSSRVHGTQDVSPAVSAQAKLR